jgi:hypothetical protein
LKQDRQNRQTVRDLCRFVQITAGLCSGKKAFALPLLPPHRGGMTKPASTKPPLANFTPLELARKISTREAAEMNDVSEDTFKRNYQHLIRKISARRNVVSLGDAITLPPKPA